MNAANSTSARHRPVAGTTGHAKAVASVLSTAYTPGDQDISARPRSAGIDMIHVDVSRDIYRFVIDVPAVHAVHVAAVLAGLNAPQPHTENHDWVQLGRDGFNAGLEHQSPLANPIVAAAISANMSEPDRVAEITAQYRRGWDAASEDSTRAGLAYSCTARRASPSISCGTTSVTRSSRSCASTATPRGFGTVPSPPTDIPASCTRDGSTSNSRPPRRNPHICSAR